MYLEKLEIQGFKSFAHKVSLSFNQGITAIVGPNGSGKSNVSDAVRWVLGEQSMKLLRGKKAEDVIFAGSDKKNRLGSAEVSLHINNEDGRAPVDASQVVITRRVFRSGESDYLMNNRPTRLSDIALLLAKSNFGQRSYSIIGQGMIDEVLSATPQGRKAFFDEAAGVRVFQIKKEQALNKLSLTKENLTRAELLIQEIEPRMRSLTRQVKRLERRSEIEQELRVHQDAYYRSLWHDVRDQLDGVKNNHAAQERERKTLEEKRRSIEEKLRHEELQKTRHEAFQALQREYQGFVDQKNSLEREYAAIRGKRDANLSAKGKTNVVWLQRKKDELEQERLACDEQAQEMDREQSVVAKQRAELDEKRGALERRIREIESEMTETRQRIKQTVSLPEIAQHLEQIFSKHEQVVARAAKAESIEHLASLKRDIESIHEALKGVMKKVRNSDNQEASQAVVTLEASLRQSIQQKEALFREETECVSHERVIAERKANLDRKAADIDAEIDALVRELEEASAGDSDRQDILAKQEEDVKKKIEDIDRRSKESRIKLEQFNKQEQEKRDALVSLQKTLSEVNQRLSEVVRTTNQYAVEIARLETRSEDLDREMRQDMPHEAIEQVKKNKPSSIDRGETYSQILQLKKQLEMIGGIDPQVEKEYSETKVRFDFLTNQVADLRKAIEDLESAIDELEQTIKKRFGDAFERINKEFQVYFKKLFGGGRASLELVKEDRYVDEDNEAIEDEDIDDQDGEQEEEQAPAKKTEKVISGVAIYATPPGKKLKNVSTLSGGERALTSIALICAIIASNPSPFVVLDEVDAALDEANSERFAAILQSLAKRSQFITITHNRATMEHASLLYGVTMGDDGVSKLLSVDIEHAEDIIKRTGNR